MRVVPGVPLCMGGDPEHVQMIPWSSENCPGIVVSLAGLFISFPFVVLPGINQAFRPKVLGETLSIFHLF